MKRKSEKKEKKWQDQTGAISTLVLFTVFMFMLILTGVYFSVTTMEKAQLKSDLRIQAIYGKTVQNVEEIYNELVIPKVADSKNIFFEKETIVKDSNDNKIVIPAGFKIATDSGNNVTEGIVIEDDDTKVDGNGNQRGNQYIWIPVSNIDGSDSNPIKKSDNTEIVITLGRYEFADGTSSYLDNEGGSLGVLNKGTEIIRQYAKDYQNPVTIQSFYEELKDYRAENEKDDLTGLNRTAKDLKGFIDSVKENRGYYIARYEASYGENGKANSKVTINENNTSSGPTKEGYLWNNITQIDAAVACEGIYDTVSSDLINSYAWDTAIVYIQKFSGRTDYSWQSSINKNLANTGTNNDEVCKIHDMASNCWEWTTEYSTYTPSSLAYPCVHRGGDFNSSHSNYCTSIRYSLNATRSYKFSTFRPILYIK